MQMMSLAGLQPNFSEGVESPLLSGLRARKRKAAEDFQKKVDFSFDEEKVGNKLSEFFSTQLPEGRKLEASKHPNKLAAVSAAFSEDDPRKALIPQVKQNYQTLLRNKNYAAADENQLLSAAYEMTVKGTPSQNLEGASFEDDIHRYKFKQDTAIFGGENVAAAPGYDEWLQKEKARPIEDRLTGFGENTAMWAAGDAAFHMLRKPVGEAIGRA